MFIWWIDGDEYIYEKEDDKFLKCKPFPIDFEWILKFKRAKYIYEKFTGPAISKPHVFNENAKKQLAKIIIREAKRLYPDNWQTNLSGTGLTFDFTQEPYTRWKDLYYTETYISLDKENPAETMGIMDGQYGDGLFAALGSFNIRALADCVAYISEGKLFVSVRGVKVYARDIFNFDSDMGGLYLVTRRIKIGGDCKFPAN